MKKTVCVVLAVIAVFALAACKSGHEVVYDKLPVICRISNPLEGITAKIELSKWDDDPFKAENAAKNATVSIGDKEFTGEYTNSSYILWTGDIKHTYKVSDNVLFSIDDGGKLVEFSSSNAVSGENLVTKDTAVEIAKDFIRQHYPDTVFDKYTITTNFDDTTKQYTVSVIKYLGDRATLDNVTLVMSKTGGIVKFECHNFGKIPDNAADEINFDKVEGELLAKCKSVSKKAEKLYSEVVSEPYTYIITLDEEGRPAIVSAALIHCRNTYDMIATGDYETLVLYFANDLLK